MGQLVICLLLSVSLADFLCHLFIHAMGKISSLTEVQRVQIDYTEKDTQKGTLVLNCVAPRQRCTMLSSDSMLMARFATRKGLVVHGRPLSDTNNVLAKHLLQENNIFYMIIYALNVEQYVPGLFRDVTAKNLD